MCLTCTGLWENEDKNGDMLVSWEEFGGPKGTSVDDRPEEETTAEEDAGYDEDL